MEPEKEAIHSYIFKAFRFGDNPIKLHVHLADVFVFLITELVDGTSATEMGNQRARALPSRNCLARRRKPTKQTNKTCSG